MKTFQKEQSMVRTVWLSVLAISAFVLAAPSAAMGADASAALDKVGVNKGISSFRGLGCPEWSPFRPKTENSRGRKKFPWQMAEAFICCCARTRCTR